MNAQQSSPVQQVPEPTTSAATRDVTSHGASTGGFLGHEDSRRRLARIGMLLWMVLLYAAVQPGLMSGDSIDQYGQGLAGSYSDIHPPLGSWLIGLSGRLVGSPWLILVLQLAMLSGGMAVLIRSTDARAGRRGLVVFGAFLLIPTVWSLAVVLWKDVMVAALLLCAVVALKSRRPFVALLLLCAGVAYRHNALVAAVPLAIPVVAQLAPAPRWRFPARVLVFICVVPGLVITPLVVSRALHAQKAWAAGQLFLYDLAGVYVAHPESFPGSILEGETSVPELTKLYNISHVWPLLGGMEGARPISFGSLETRRAAFVDEWKRIVRQHPKAWMKHRVTVFRRMLGADPHPVWNAFHQQIDPNPWQLKPPTDGFLFQSMLRIENALSSSFFFRGWVWLLGLLGVSLVALRRVKRHSLAFFTGMSGLAYASAYLVIGIGSDFRFIYWSVIALFATLALLVSPPEQTDSSSKPV
ncbi:hypothetical protein MYSTI_00413 [Myxococcus stipitatus DSM 14675]|uniref:Glycosyltransferase RgtA/B/C/D-like domain-containing protein n=1 Tax=Myxococcus stipitatus (strain DSM 14675 / JCM 12634 / Mx s8) TaxID=1278073 RepID=L7U1P1_MYXSD|nr:hypothetical protein [Myxococcus stipitatus]AGC41765.1 hypothetical protein MYSTI_00413 [Myxococcus stipitatus DSM 14675]